MIAAVRRLQESQLSVQAMTRLASVGLFLLASWTDSRHVALIAVQGALLAIPYTLVEAMVGRPLSAGVVPGTWRLEAWAARAAAAIAVPAAVVGFAAVSVALPGSGILDRLLVVAPVLLQLPVEALFWVAFRTRGRRRANALPQSVAAGTLLTAAVFAVAGLRLEVAAVPAQIAVLAWAFATRPAGGPHTRPGPLAGVRIGAAYCVAAAVDLGYVVALPAVAGVLAGPAAIVVLRAMDLAFGPFHVALAATTREDVVAGRSGRFRTGARLLTAVLLVATSVAVLAGPWARGLLSADLAAASVGVVALYCVYKAAVMVSTWLSMRHMVRAAPRTYLVSAIGSRVVAFASLAVALLWVRHTGHLFAQLAAAEAVVVAWFAARLRTTGARTGAAGPGMPDVPAAHAGTSTSDGTSTSLVGPSQRQEDG
ncbi:hypothetical protein [Mangrovihabitans endophyticus]|uniref:Uncharacterized protein n=1 Tax=Mangrovihabitans endophyticus TaxID=1751298 RepID=A0A8J3C8D4_9ACTN|nr:hypothetical protein [Mangrovihabitans endophyticus]GGL19519.1 hypothetical protein GCM10012284_62580 [Mangrovihabitans endophyticus]